MKSSELGLGGAAARWVPHALDLVVSANYDGSSRMHVVTQEPFRRMGMNLARLVGVLRIDDIDTNAGVTLKLQHSPDGQKWQDASSPIVTEQTSVDDYTGSNSTPEELLPHLRLVVLCRDTVGTNQLTARVSVWGDYLYRV